MADNKVYFGIEELHVWEYEVADDGTVSFGSPYHQKGAVSFSPDPDASENTDYADDIPYWSEFSDGPISGDLEVMKYDDSFKKRFLGYKKMTSGGLAQVKGANRPKVCVAFQYLGDVEKRREVFYNCSLGPIKRDYSTITDTKEPQHETITVNCAGDNVTGAFRETLKPGDTGYDNLFTNPTVPDLESES